ncbi:MAG: hypothetical protein AB1505_28535 [Candidatus Latescibacterota bacterium]
MLWAILAFALVAITKYLTSLRLRRLRARIEQDRQAADELRRRLGQASEKEEVLKARIEELSQKARALTHVVATLQRATAGSVEPEAVESEAGG